MKGIDLKFLDQLKSRLSLVDVVREYYELEQRGRNFWCCCPFHGERTASFCVNGVDNFYHCFGCGKSGDVITFIMEVESCDFVDAVRILAKKANMEMPDLSYDNEKIKEQKKKKERMLSLLKDTALFYLNNLRSDKADKHREYLSRRGLSQETVNKFGIGASLSGDGLVRHLQSLKYAKDEMVECGVVGNKDGRYYDFLSERVIIPVIDQYNQVVAFCGRVLEDKGFAKYVNTRETLVFSKGNTLFNVNNLKKLKQQTKFDYVLLVEGHMDVVSLVSAGFENVVASMGTSLTDKQAKLLSRFSENVVLCYDGDFAGQKAAERGAQILLDSGLNVKIIMLPDGFDPDDVIKKQGKEAFSRLIEQAMPLIDFKLRNLENKTDFSSQYDRRDFVKKAVAIVSESNSPSEREQLLKDISKKTGITLNSLIAEVNGVRTVSEKVEEPIKQKAENDALSLAERVVLWAVIFSKPYAEDANLSALKFSSEARSEIVQLIIDEHAKNKKIIPNMLFELIGEGGESELSKIMELEVTEMIETNETKLFEDCILKIKRENIQREIDEILATYRAENSLEKRGEIAKKLNDKINEKKLLK